MKWAVWYEDGQRYDSDRVDWTVLPHTGLQILIVYVETGRTIYCGADWYWLYNGKFGHTPSKGWDGWVDRPDIACFSCIKQGTGVDDDSYKALKETALKYKP